MTCDNNKNTSIADSSCSREEGSFNNLYQSPAKLVLTIAVIVFIAESLTMVIIAQIPGISTGIANILDSIVLVTLLIPVFMLFIFRPLLLQITVRKNAEAELIIEKNKLNDVLDAMLDGVYIINDQSRIEYFNKAIVNECGQANSCRFYEYAQDPKEPCLSCNMSEVINGSSVRGEWKSSRTGKTYDLFEKSIRNFDGSLSRMVILHDITEQKNALEVVRDSREQLRNLSAHLQKAREEERAAISREIHDELGQVLAALQFDISWVMGKLHEDQVPLIEKTAAMSSLIVNAVKTVQKITSNLRPKMLEELGLAEAIEWQAQEFQKRSGIYCVIDIELESNNISLDISTAIYRIFQEALTNVLRHAGATRVSGMLTERRGRVVLFVQDNGRGILRQQIKNPLSTGLIGLRERARILGGSAMIRGSVRNGTSILVQIPIAGGKNIMNVAKN